MIASETLDHLEGIMSDWLSKQDTQSFPTLSTEKISEMHHIAFHLYRDKQYEKAGHFFRLLTIIDPSDMKYWKGLGASLQLAKKYQEAVECYASAVLVGSDQPDPYLFVHAADCFFALDQKEQGLKALEGAKLSAELRKDMQVIAHVALMQELWSKNNT